ncbi:MAG: cysteine hydrolase [Firmicutes bacterium]|nr:cysteine hydrolase [Bacillota bacterium]
MLETKFDLQRTALLIIDMQNDLIKAEKEPFRNVTKMGEAKGIIQNTAKVAAAARQVGMPVVYACHVHKRDHSDVIPNITDWMLQGIPFLPDDTVIEGTVGAQIVDELAPASGEHVVWKRRANAFYNSDLELILRCRGIDTVIMGGVVTDGCVANTVRGARERDLRVIVLSDCCATMMPEDDDYFLKKVFPKIARVRTAEEIVAVLSNRGLEKG